MGLGDLLLICPGEKHVVVVILRGNARQPTLFAGGVISSWAMPCQETPQHQFRLKRAAMQRQDKSLLAVPLWPAVGVAAVMAACVLALQRQLRKWSGRQHSPKAPGCRQLV